MKSGSIFSALLLIMAATGRVLAADTVTGWSVTFYQDTFEKTVSPVGSVYNDRNVVLSMKCRADRTFAITFDAVASDVTTLLARKEFLVSFRKGGKQLDLTFGPDTETDSSWPTLSKAESMKLLDLMSDGDELVAYRSKSFGGVFASVGAKQVAETLTRYCS